MEQIILAARDYVKNRFLMEMKKDDGYYRYTHTLRVAEIGRKIARAEGMDEEMLVLGCLLHDIGYVACKKHTDYADHGLQSAQIARQFLLEQGYDPEKTESICYGIRIHTQPEEEMARPATTLELSVQDADNIDRFDAWRFSRNLYWDGLDKLTVRQMKDLAQRRVSRMEELRSLFVATAAARAMLEEKLQLWTDFYSRLERQMDLTRSWDPEI